MINQGKYNDDPLRQYISPGNRVQAPEGFTSKIMSRIQFKTESIEQRSKFHVKSWVPIISILVTIVLIVTAFLIPHSETGSIIQKVISYLPELNLSISMDKINSLFTLVLPGWFPYILISIFILVLLDRAFISIFHREK
jgi:hypothetical protein